MKVRYTPPMRKPDSYNFEGTNGRYSGEVEMQSLKDLYELQTQLLDVVGFSSQFLESYELPDKINGHAQISFNRFYATKNRLVLPAKKFGYIGFPNILVQTSLGSSMMDLRPDIRGRIKIQVWGRGIAEDTMKHTLPYMEDLFNSSAPLNVTINETPEDYNQTSGKTSVRVRHMIYVKMDMLDRKS